MPRQAFERELQRLQNDILILGSMVEKAILRSVEVLKRRDLAGSQQLVADDLKINKKRFEVESDCLVVIATQQPMASDLRTLAAILEIATELERMGDYGKGIARVSLMIGDQPLLKPLIDVPRMAERGCQMLRQALDAFIWRDVELARSIPGQDDEIDALYNQVYRELLTFIMSDPRTITQATHLLWVAHNLERFADRVTNICERVIFTVTGEMMEMDMEQDHT